MRPLDCSSAEATMIREAARVTLAKLADGLCGLEGLNQLRGCMIARLNAVLPLSVRCSDCEGLSAYGFSIARGRGEIGICRAALERGQDRLNSVFFHELVHACGGNELDAEGLEANCFAGAGATPPSPGDYRLFGRALENGYAAGRFLLWEPHTGRLFVKGADGRPLGAPLRIGFRAPEP